ncbi:MAG: phosphoenolpyruvate carboxylase, partial [Ilumatobacteraceae bacterium]
MTTPIGEEALSEDIRLLGRLLGDVIRDQAGDGTFDLVESVRRIAVHGRRQGTTAVRELHDVLIDQPIEEQLHVIRAFDWLALLANTAEDVHLDRRSRYHRAAGHRARPGSLDASFDRLAEADVAPEVVASVVGDLEVSPVITAHPTEVRRQTIRNELEQVAALLNERSRLGDDLPGIAEIDARLDVHVLTLWQTALLRLSKLRVRDEINEALRYYDSSLFRTVPELSRDLARVTEARVGAVDLDTTLAINMGSWIGGDRDGNPFVTADVLHLATQRQMYVALGHHLQTLFDLARELSMSSRLIDPTPELLALAKESGDESPFRADEPYRQALRGMYARLYGFAAEVLDDATGPPGPTPRVPLPRYRSMAELLTDLDTVSASLRSHGAGDLAAAKVEPADRAVAIFGAHLCGLEMRQNSAVHEHVVGELLRSAGECDDYASLAEAERVALLTAELSSPRVLRHPGAAYDEQTLSELAIL